MVRKELCWNANVLSEVEKGLRSLCFTFHGMDVDEVLTHVDLELCALPQGCNVDWCGVGVEESAKAATPHRKCVIAASPGDGVNRLAHSLLHGAAKGWSGLWQSNAPLLSEGLC